ncbi:hypothetical protein ACFYXM_31775 [Streptomyces sp. NPDC002476]|uniref:hypothetical protein n=1 Tax=Streptomyces sp. NPDC002476 TaxID=3364648 RepID=UPI0036C2D0D8
MEAEQAIDELYQVWPGEFVAARTDRASEAQMAKDAALARRIAKLHRPTLLPLIAQPAAMGALPTLRAATDPTVTGGQYYGPGGMGGTRGHPRLVTSSKKSHDTALQQRLWAASEQLTDVNLPDKTPDTPSERASRASFQRQDIARNAHTAHNAHAQNRRSGALHGRFKDRDALHMVRHRKSIIRKGS